MTWANYDDVLRQLISAGFVEPKSEWSSAIDCGKKSGVRCKVKGAQQGGAISMHTITLDDGRSALIGAGWYYKGAEKVVVKLDLRVDSKPVKMQAEKLAAIRARQKEIERQAEEELERRQERAAEQAARWWRKLLDSGASAYMERKGFAATDLFGARISPSGNLVVPMQDKAGKIWGLEVIYPSKCKGPEGNRRDKDTTPPGCAKKGRFFQLGTITRGCVVLLCEGFATGASLHKATGLPVVVAFSAGNLSPVADAIYKAHRKDVRILICADDDHKTENKTGKNPGKDAANTAALTVCGSVVWPVVFSGDRPQEGKGPTDFNDLHVHPDGGLNAVRVQIEASLAALGWGVRATPRAGFVAQGGGERAALKSMLTIDEAVDRFALVFGGKSTIFDHQEHILVPKADVMDIIPEHGWRDMRAVKQVVRMDEVGFDPACTDKKIKCNLWGGWPTTPKQGRCDVLIELLEYLCSEEENYRTVFEWVLKWIAYPIQHPGAKMRTALVFHGPQGTGKNLFFEAVMAIYGEYGRIVDQAAIEDKFNDWASRKLLMIADEVVARQELYHVKNKLKSFVTGEWIRINPKNVAAHDEKNHVNLVFLSNESQPLVLEKDDRRYTIIHTPEKLSAEFYQQVRDELNNGGIAALHHYLLNLDLGDFDEHSKPPMTKAKENLIDVSLDSVQRFVQEWHEGEIFCITGSRVDDDDLPLPFIPCLGRHLYITYKKWCDHSGERSPRSLPQFIGTIKNMPRWKAGQPVSTHKTQFTIKTISRKMVIPPDELLTTSRNSIQRNDKTQAVWLTECFFAFAKAGEFEP